MACSSAGSQLAYRTQVRNNANVYWLLETASPKQTICETFRARSKAHELENQMERKDKFSCCWKLTDENDDIGELLGYFWFLCQRILLTLVCLQQLNLFLLSD